MKLHNLSALRILLGASLLVGIISSAAVSAERMLKNNTITARFGDRGLVSITDTRSGKTIDFGDNGSSITVDGKVYHTDKLDSSGVTETSSTVTYTYSADGTPFKVVYELKPAWVFLSKQLVFAGESAAYRVNTVNMLQGSVSNQIASEHKINNGNYGACLRFGEGKPTHGMLFVIQNPFNKWQHEGRNVAMAYQPEMDWKSEYGQFESDRLLLAPYTLSGVQHISKALPAWRYYQDLDAEVAKVAKIDMAEIDAYQAGVAAFTEFSIDKSVKIMVGWCTNDYQIDAGTPEGMAEYKRIIDRTADLGGEYILYAPANSQVSSERESRDAWGWENVLFFGMGQQIRKDEWNPATDEVPACVQEMIDYARARGVKLVAYAYPTMPYMQDLAWTAWCNNKPGSYSGVDTGIRSFQDWFVGKLVDFQKKTGAGGYAFDHWWIAYDSRNDSDTPVSSRYAQWYGCRRIISELRKALPDIVVDGRQQYHHFGPWTWVGGSYPHPFGGDEQPGSFRARANLSTDRLSANHIRWVNWRFRMENFCPPEMVPGYMTHQTQRSDEKGTMRRDPWRRADWDQMGWKYSVLSSIATAPLNHVLNFIPARDTAEFKAFSKADQKWWKEWMEWTDKNQEILRNYRFINPPALGKTDGTAAFKDDKGFIFLFNGNYRRLPAEFTLDASIGLTRGTNFVITELYPNAGRLVGKPGAGFWKMGDKVNLPMLGNSAVVLEVKPAPAVAAPVLFNSTGKAVLSNGKLDLTSVRGETGTALNLVVALPQGKTATAVTVNGKKVAFKQTGSVVSTSVQFAGVPFSQSQQVGKYDPKFSGTVFKSEFSVPKRVFNQLEARKKAWPVNYTADDMIAPWIGPDRLLLFVNIADSKPSHEVTIKINGKPVEVKRAFNGIYPNSGNQTYIGVYADVANLKPDTKYQVEVGLPEGLEPGQFQGLFFDNVETEYTQSVAR